MASLARIRAAERAVEDTRRLRDAAALEETRIALSLEVAPEGTRPPASDHTAARSRLAAAGMAHERALRALCAILAESPAEEHELGDPLAGLTTRIDPLGQTFSARDTA